MTSEYERLKAQFDVSVEKQRLKTVLTSPEFIALQSQLTALTLERDNLRAALEDACQCTDGLHSGGDGTCWACNVRRYTPPTASDAQ